jgi:small subunit ribosomal protein S14
VAKKSMIARELKKAKLVDKYFKRRQALKIKLKKADSLEQVEEIQKELQKLPVNSNSSRLTKRCKQCGRPHAVYRKFGLCRICLRNRMMRGEVPGGRKSSW